MQQLLTKGIGHTRFKDSPLGEIPESWEVFKLGKLGEFSKGKGISKSELSDSGFPCIRYGEIYTVHDTIIRNFFSFIDPEVATQSIRIKKNEILFAGSGETVEDIGKAVVFIGDEEAYAGGDIIIFSPSLPNSIFLSYCLNSKLVINQRSKFGQGHSVVHIYSRDLSELLVPVPTIEEQSRISRLFIKIDDKVDFLREKKNEYEQLKKGLMQQLLTGAIRVKI
ncbi:MAG: restriction endonuclease subunit S [Bacteroidia bacterium]|nr:restriction endonuclease subunit S [Bacteroidia bacterium]